MFNFGKKGNNTSQPVKGAISKKQLGSIDFNSFQAYKMGTGKRKKGGKR